jgi:hypothetical protein
VTVATVLRLMLYPPSLSQAVQSRAFVALNGELGILPRDADEFLDACEADGIAVLSWEVWLANHRWAISPNGPVPAEGEWCGGVPGPSDSLPAVMGGVGDSSEVRRQIAKFDINSEVGTCWRDFVRINFTLKNPD